MPFSTFDDTVSGSGAADLGGNRVYYVAWRVTVDGNRVRQPTEDDSDHLNGVGYFSLGNALDGASDFAGDGWGDEHWMNWRQGQWIVPPGEVGTSFSRAIAGRIHWGLSAGTEVHLFVLGDNE